MSIIMVFNYQAVVVGVSAGGFKAIQKFLYKLPSTFTIPIIIVQHREKSPANNYLVKVLAEISKLKIKEADEKEIIKNGTVYLAPPNYHLLIEKNHTFSLSVSEPVCFARPSIDVLFETAARAYNSHLIGIILTGANKDGSQGIKAIKKRGGMTIVQNPNTAEVPIMPKAAIATNSIDFILNLENIASFLSILIKNANGVQCE